MREKSATWMLVGLAALSLTGCQSGGDKNAAAAGPGGQAMPVQVETAAKKPVKDETEFIGTIRSLNSAVMQPQVEGYLTKILVHSGEKVRRGQRLMQIDPEKQQATVHTQEATRESKSAQLQLAQTQLERSRKLASAGVISKQELDQAQATYDAARADAASLQASVSEQREQLRYYTISAPVDGTVGDIPVRVGDRVATTTVLTTVDSGSALELYINIPAERAKDVHLGTPVEIQGDTPDAKPYRTKISFISPRIDETNQLLLVKAEIPRNEPRFRNEQVVHAGVIWKEDQEIVLPFYAVSRLSGQLFAFVAQKNGDKTTAQQRSLQADQMSGSEYVVQSGVQPGDQVIVSGVSMLVDGMPVQPMPADSGGKASGDTKPAGEKK